LRYNIVVMPSSHNSMREYSFSKFTLVCLGILCSLILLGAIGSIVGGIFIYNQKHQVVMENEELVNKNTELENYKKDLDREIEQVREMEKMIRGAYGIRKENANQNEDDGILMQGGSFDSDLYDYSEETTSGPVQQMDYKSKELDGNLPLIEKIRIVKESIRDIYNYAVDQEEDIACTPSINPIQKGQFWFSSEFGWRIHPFTGKRQFHHGLDIAARKGTEVVAPANGEVIEIIKKDRYLGNTVKIKHCSKYATYTTVYGHLDSFAKGLKVGDKVKRHDLIGYVGNSGRYTTGPHLHYEVHLGKKLQNPRMYIIQ